MKTLKIYFDLYRAIVLLDESTNPVFNYNHLKSIGKLHYIEEAEQVLYKFGFHYSHKSLSG